MFTFRHQRTLGDIRRQRLLEASGPQRVLITGSTGLVGSALVACLLNGGHSVTRLVRPNTVVRAVGLPAAQTTWDPQHAQLDAPGIEGHNAVVHLAGANIGQGRWTPARKRELFDSRVTSTRLLAERLAGLSRKPRVLIVASGSNIYQPGDAPHNESGPLATGFLGELAQAWEAAAQPAVDAGIRVVYARIGVVMAAQGGMLAALRLPFSLGLDAVIGDGHQWLSWISLDDCLSALYRCMAADGPSGPVNVVSPFAVTHNEFASTLARVLSRPRLLRVPTGLMHLLAGEIASTLSKSNRVVPGTLQTLSFNFAQPRLEDTLRSELGQPLTF